MKHVEVYEIALQMVCALRPAIERIRHHDSDLAVQLKRAGSSVPGNIAEGARRAGQDRLHHYRIAAGSAGEIRSHLAVAVAWGDVDQTTVAPALAPLDSSLAILGGLRLWPCSSRTWTWQFSCPFVDPQPCLDV